MQARPTIMGMVVSAVVLAATHANAELAPLAPYQMVRSLQLVQDRIADGDHAALPMQRKLVELIDERLRVSGYDEFDDERNFRALLIYAMSGGNPRTVETIMTRLVLDETDARMATGVLEYLRGRMGSAATALKDVDPREVASEVAAFLALIKGSIAANDDPDKGLAYLDMARLMGPGTLIEEAALRRSAMLSVSQRETTRFLSLSEQYVRRFLRSPYASQFADAFVEGVAQLHGTIDLTLVAETIAAMNAEQGKVIYLRLARRAAIDQHTELLAFARGGLEKMAAEVGSEEDPRAILYSTVAAVTTDDVDAVRAQLNTIDHRRLSAGDRMLLDAALRIVDDVTSEPREDGPDEMLPGLTFPETVDAGSTNGDGDGETMPVVEASADADSAGGTYVSDVRKQLESIDKMLQETEQ
jgi:chemotaxis protein MotC